MIVFAFKVYKLDNNPLLFFFRQFKGKSNKNQGEEIFLTMIMVCRVIQLRLNGNLTYFIQFINSTVSGVVEFSQFLEIFQRFRETLHRKELSKNS